MKGKSPAQTSGFSGALYVFLSVDLRKKHTWRENLVWKVFLYDYNTLEPGDSTRIGLCLSLWGSGGRRAVHPSFIRRDDSE